MKINTQWLKDRAKEKSTYASILGIVGSIFGIQYLIPADMLAEVLTYVAVGIIGGAGVTLETKKGK